MVKYAMTVDDDELAKRLASCAGEICMAIKASNLFSGAMLGDIADSVSNSYLVGALRALRPMDAILSEEETDSGERTSHARVWIVDPLDGTREYSENRSDWAIHVALCIDGQPLIGAVSLPAVGQTFSTSHIEYPVSLELPLKIAVSRSRPPAFVERLASRMQADLVPMGSAGAKAMAVVNGAVHAYVHAGGQYEWDSAAPVAVALAAGLHASRLDGSPLIYNQEDTLLPDLVICRPEWKEKILKDISMSEDFSTNPEAPASS